MSLALWNTRLWPSSGWCFQCRALQLKIVHLSLTLFTRQQRTEMVSAACPSLCGHRKERHILLYVLLPSKTARDAFVSFLIIFGFHSVLSFFLSLASSVRSMRWKCVEAVRWLWITCGWESPWNLPVWPFNKTALLWNYALVGNNAPFKR